MAVVDARSGIPPLRPLGGVEARDLAIYEALSAIGGGQWGTPHSSIGSAATVSVLRLHRLEAELPTRLVRGASLEIGDKQVSVFELPHRLLLAAF